MKNIKSENTIGNFRVSVNENFEELDKRLKEVEEILKIKKPKK